MHIAKTKGEWQHVLFLKPKEIMFVKSKKVFGDFRFEIWFMLRIKSQFFLFIVCVYSEVYAEVNEHLLPDDDILLQSDLNTHKMRAHV